MIRGLTRLKRPMGAVVMLDIHPKLILKTKNSRYPVCLNYPFHLSNRLAILHRARQWYCRTLWKITKRVDSWTISWGIKRFCEMWVQDASWTGILYWNDPCFLFVLSKNTYQVYSCAMTTHFCVSCQAKQVNYHSTVYNTRLYTIYKMLWTINELQKYTQYTNHDKLLRNHKKYTEYTSC